MLNLAAIRHRWGGRCPPKAIWGPADWRLLHAFSFRFPDRPSPADRAFARAFLVAFVEGIPCRVPCLAHARSFLAASPPDLRSGPAFRLWGLGFHNAVNASLGRPPWDFGRLAATYAQFVPLPSGALAAPPAPPAPAFSLWLAEGPLPPPSPPLTPRLVMFGA